MKLIVNKDICVGCGSCVQANDKIFQLGEDGKSQVIGDFSEFSLEQLKELAGYCPVEAIEIYDDAGKKLFPAE